MKNLQHYIDNRNQWNSFFPNSKQITFPLDQKTVNDLARSLDGDCTGYLMGVSNRINDILDANGLYAEWINPGCLAVCEA